MHGNWRKFLGGNEPKFHEVKDIRTKTLNSHTSGLHIRWAERNFATEVDETTMVKIETLVQDLIEVFRKVTAIVSVIAASKRE